MNTVTGGPAIVISTTASSSYMVSRGEGRGGDWRSQGPRIPHFPEENDLVMAVKPRKSSFQSKRWKKKLLYLILFHFPVHVGSRRGKFSIYYIGRADAECDLVQINFICCGSLTPFKFPQYQIMMKGFASSEYSH